MKLFTLNQIREVLPAIDLLQEIEGGFLAYSQGHAVVPPVGEMILDKGEVHIKSGFIRKEMLYVIKIASGFYDNPALGLPSGNGLMLLFSQQTGELVSILLDEGYLTDIRTAVAGAVVARYLAPPVVERIGIVGTGTQARLQLMYLKSVVPCREVLVWGRSKENLSRYQLDMEKEGFSVKTTRSAARVMKQCNLIVTTTPSKKPILDSRFLVSGTHITSMGSDTKEKQELDPLILQRADLIVADSLAQCMERGEIFQASEAGVIGMQKVEELGEIIAGTKPGRTGHRQISVADLTGVAVQDIAIAGAVYRALTESQ